jgi:hypothetical protein
MMGAVVGNEPSVLELDLPLLDTTGLDRAESIAVAAELSREHWLARTDLGVAVLRYRDVAAVLRDRRFHSALSRLPLGPADPDGGGR